MVGWLAGWLVDWVSGCLVGRLVRGVGEWVLGRANLFAGCLVGWLVCWLAGRLVDGWVDQLSLVWHALPIFALACLLQLGLVELCVVWIGVSWLVGLAA